MEKGFTNTDEYERAWQKTRALTITEFHLLIPMIKEEKKVDQIHIELFTDQIIVANSICTVMFNQIIN